MASLFILASFSFVGCGASPTATHIYPGPAKTGKPIAINVTIDPHNTMPTSVVAYWWTSLSEIRSQAVLSNSSGEPKNWKGQIPAQSSPCDVYYTIRIDYLYYNDNIGALSQDTIYLPSAGNYLVSVKGELFGNLSPWSVAIGIALMILAVGIILYAQRLVARASSRYEESAKATTEEDAPGKNESDGPSEKPLGDADNSKGAPPSS